MSKIRIEMTDKSRGKVWIDDQEITGVTSVSFSAGVGESCTVSISCYPDVLDITSMDADVRRCVSLRPEKPNQSDA